MPVLQLVLPLLTVETLDCLGLAGDGRRPVARPRPAQAAAPPELDDSVLRVDAVAAGGLAPRQIVSVPHPVVRMQEDARRSVHGFTWWGAAKSWSRISKLLC